MKNEQENSIYLGDKLRLLYDSVNIDYTVPKWSLKVCKEMYDRGILEYKSNLETDDTKAKQRADTAVQIREHLSERKCGIMWLKRYSIYFGISADFFLNQTHETDKINNSTGLSERSVQVLQILNNSNNSPTTADTLDILLSDVKQTSLLFNAIQLYLSPTYTVPAHLDESLQLILDRQQIPNSEHQECFLLASEDGKAYAGYPIDQSFHDTVNIQRIKDCLDVIRNKI